MAGTTPADDTPRLGEDIPVETGVVVGEDQSGNFVVKGA